MPQSSTVSAGDTALATQYNSLRIDALANRPTIVVAPSGGDYTTIAAAMSAASEGDTIFVKSGTYASVGAITGKNGIKLIGENKNNTIIENATLTFSGTDKTSVGTITLTNNSTTVEGAGGTQFSTDSVAAGDYLFVQSLGLSLEIASVTDEDTIELVNTYEGATQAALSFEIKNVFKDIEICNIQFKDANANFDGVIQIESLLNIHVHDNIFINSDANKYNCIDVNSTSSVANVHFYNNYIEGISRVIINTNAGNNFNLFIYNNIANSLIENFALVRYFLFGEISNNIISGSGSTGIDISTGSKYINVRDNKIINSSIGINLGSDNNAINNIINNCASTGLQFIDNCIVSGNNVYSNTGNGLYSASGDRCTIIANISQNNTSNGIRIVGGNRNAISGNVVNDNGGDGILLDSNSDNNIISSNSVYNNTGTGILINAATEDKNVVGDNISLSNGTNYTDTGTNTSASNNITA